MLKCLLAFWSLSSRSCLFDYVSSQVLTVANLWVCLTFRQQLGSVDVVVNCFEKEGRLPPPQAHCQQLSCLILRLLSPIKVLRNLCLRKLSASERSSIYPAPTGPLTPTPSQLRVGLPLLKDNPPLGLFIHLLQALLGSFASSFFLLSFKLFLSLGSSPTAMNMPRYLKIWKPNLSPAVQNSLSRGVCRTLSLSPPFTPQFTHVCLQVCHFYLKYSWISPPCQTSWRFQALFLLFLWHFTPSNPWKHSLLGGTPTLLWYHPPLPPSTLRSSLVRRRWPSFPSLLVFFQ